MNALVKVAIGGAGAYLLYNYAKSSGMLDGGSPAPVPAAGGAAAQPPVVPATGTVVSPPASGSAAGTPDLLNLMRAEAALDPIWLPQMNVHQWCYLYSKVRNTPCPPPPADSPASMTMADWYSLMRPLGVSGVAGYSL